MRDLRAASAPRGARSWGRSGARHELDERDADQAHLSAGALPSWPTRATSYERAYDLVRAPDEAGATARLVPLTVDGLIYASSMVMVIRSSQAPADSGSGSDHDADPLQETAAEVFAELLAEDRVPSIRAIRAELPLLDL
jgi:hypothetical protein